MSRNGVSVMAIQLGILDRLLSLDKLTRLVAP
jgi:hypothetical protein